MVTKKFLVLTTLLSFIILIWANSSFMSTVGFEASTIQYRLNHEYVKVWVNQDGTIDLMYNTEITCIQGEINYVKVGQPTGDFTIGEAKDSEGHVLRTADVSEGEYYAVRVDLYTPLKAGQTVTFTLTTNVGHMIWEDEENPENVGMLFTPSWWDTSLDDLRVAVVLPEGVTKQNVKCTPDWDNAYNDPEEDGRFVIYWERQNLKPNEKISFGVSFPKEYVTHYEVREEGLDWGVLGTIFGGIAIIVGFGVIVYTFRKKSYVKPTLLMETLGVRRGLTAVEASYLLDFPPNKIVTEILYSLLRKKAVWVTETTPSLKLKVMEEFKDGTGTYGTPLRYYEKSFLKAVREDGTLDEEKLAETIMLLRGTVEEKLCGYCRKDTISYYRKVAAEAWKQVEQAGTSEIASKVYDENLLWLLLDKNFQSKTQETFRDKTFEPNVNWWWYWYIYTHYHPHPRYGPEPPTTTTEPVKIPGADFADLIVTSIEKTANNIVSSMEKFVNSILPAPPPAERTSRSPAHHQASCVCACASCACVCACVSCACACASGGVG